MASDAQLNAFAGLKKLATFRDEDKKARDRKVLGKKARVKKWRRETFGREERGREFENYFNEARGLQAAAQAQAGTQAGTRAEEKKTRKRKRGQAEKAGPAQDATMFGSRNGEGGRGGIPDGGAPNGAEGVNVIGETGGKKKKRNKGKKKGGA